MKILPQILVLLFSIISLLYQLHEDEEESFSIWATFIVMHGLLTWGGFYTPLVLFFR